MQIVTARGPVAPPNPNGEVVFGCDRTSTITNMSSPSRPKSPHTGTPKKDDREESFWDKIGTLGRKKKIKEGKSIIV